MNFDYSEAEEYEADFAATGAIEFDEFEDDESDTAFEMDLLAARVGKVYSAVQEFPMHATMFQPVGGMDAIPRAFAYRHQETPRPIATMAAGNTYRVERSIMR